MQVFADYHMSLKTVADDDVRTGLYLLRWNNSGGVERAEALSAKTFRLVEETLTNLNPFPQVFKPESPSALKAQVLSIPQLFRGVAEEVEKHPAYGAVCDRPLCDLFFMENPSDAWRYGSTPARVVAAIKGGATQCEERAGVLLPVLRREIKAFYASRGLLAPRF